MPDIRELRFGGVTYRMPFAGLFRAHTPTERSRLVASIGEHGVLVRLLTYDSATHGPRCIIDGATRLEIAAECALTAVPVHHLGSLSDADAELLARTLNADRRHLTPEEQQAAREKRNAAILTERLDGDSLRTIAQRHDVSESRVRQILDDAGAQGYAPDRVKGADGKSYPATPTAAVIVSLDPPADESTEEEQPVEADKPVQVANSAERSRTPHQVLESARRGVASLRRLFDELLAGDFAEQLRQICDRHHVELANEESSASGGRKPPVDGANPVRKGDGDRTGSLRSPLACLSTLDAILADLALEVIQQ